MNLYERIGAVIALHNPDAMQEPMVYSVWEDGEITIEKGGELFGQRTTHLVSCGSTEDALPADSLPVCNANKLHSRILCTTKELAEKAQYIIKGNNDKY